MGSPDLSTWIIIVPKYTFFFLFSIHSVWLTALQIMYRVLSAVNTQLFARRSYSLQTDCSNVCTQSEEQSKHALTVKKTRQWRNVTKHLTFRTKQAHPGHTEGNVSFAWSEHVNTALDTILSICGPDEKRKSTHGTMFQQDVLSNHCKGEHKKTNIMKSSY